jgi:hypothetical protein
MAGAAGLCRFRTGENPWSFTEEPQLLSRMPSGRAQMAELVDALVSGTSGRKAVGVRVPFWAGYRMARTTPPSTRSAAPDVADAAGEHT